MHHVLASPSMQTNHKKSDEGQLQHVMMPSLQMPLVATGAFSGPNTNQHAQGQHLQSKSLMRSRLEEIFDQQVQE